MKYEDYQDLVKGLKDLPITWYPALIMTMVRAGYKKKVFLPSGASLLIRKQEEKEGFNELE